MCLDLSRPSGAKARSFLTLRAARLKPCPFKTAHSNPLGNEFLCAETAVDRACPFCRRRRVVAASARLTLTHAQPGLDSGRHCTRLACARTVKYLQRPAAGLCDDAPSRHT